MPHYEYDEYGVEYADEYDDHGVEYNDEYDDAFSCEYET